MSVLVDAIVKKEFKVVPEGFVNNYRVQPDSELYVDKEELVVKIEEKQSGKEFELLRYVYMGLVGEGYIKEV